MKQGILVVSFGTTYVETREKNITSIVNLVKETYDMPVYEAWTSSMIMRALEKRGTHVADVPEILETIHQDGITDLYVLPTHLLYGEEYDKMNRFLDEKSSYFHAITVAKPLLANEEALRTVLTALHRGIDLAEKEALVLMGHGTPHFCNTVYAAMDHHAKDMAMHHMFVGTVEAYPDLDVVLNQVKQGGYEKVALTPLMLVAGDHATNDMASDEDDSWYTQFTLAGFETRSILKGLGEYEVIRKEYLARLAEIL